LRLAIKSLLPAMVVTRFQQKRLQRHIAQFSARTVQHTFHGFPLNVQLRDSLAAGWYDKDWPRMLELTALQTGRLRAGAKVFDLGSHQGVVAMILSRLVGETGTVIAVDGTRHNVAAAQENFRLNGLTNITAIHSVVSDIADTLIGFSETLNGQVTNGADGILSVTVDALAQKYGQPDVILLDIEGHECAALRGAKQTLTGEVDLFIEVHTGCGLEENGSVAELLSYLSESRFALWWSGGDECEFQPLDRAGPPPQLRFYLVAKSVNCSSP
jgi:FkbM family methyltransferase